MNWIRLILESFVFVVAIAAILKGIFIEDALLLGEGLFILWAWLFFLFAELKGWVKDLYEENSRRPK